MLRSSFHRVYRISSSRSGAFLSLKGMSFSDPNLGWFTSDFSIFRTVDGGRTWMSRDCRCANPHRDKISAPTQQFCAVLITYGDRIEYCFTRDGGESWKNQQIAPRWDLANDILFVDERCGWILARPEPGCNASRVFRTSDGGESWRQHNLLTGNPVSVAFANPTDGWLIAKGERTRAPLYTFVVDAEGDSETIGLGGERNWICRTEDGGQNWEPVSWFDRDLISVTVDESKSRRIFVTGFQGLLAISGDDGKTWNNIQTDFQSDLFSPVCVGDTVVIPAVGGMLASIDGGSSWSVLELDDAPFRAHLCDDRSGVIAATRGIYRFELSERDT